MHLCSVVHACILAVTSGLCLLLTFLLLLPLHLSRLDYANSILYNTTTANLHKLQRIQNTLAKAIVTTYFRISALKLRNLYWLPINKQIDLKIAVITYKLLAQNEPTYPRNLLSTSGNQKLTKLTKTISISREQKQNLGLGPFICCSKNLEFTSLRFAPLTLN
jgi:hypothetical protein